VRDLRIRAETNDWALRLLRRPTISEEQRFSEVVDHIRAGSHNITHDFKPRTVIVLSQAVGTRGCARALWRVAADFVVARCRYRRRKRDTNRRNADRRSANTCRARLVDISKTRRFRTAGTLQDHDRNRTALWCILRPQISSVAHANACLRKSSLG
jgi:hypothetical protein